MASYPGAIKTFSTVVNGVTKLVAALFNSPNDEITAIQTELGTDVAGTYSDLKTRLNSTTTFGSWADVSGGYSNVAAATDGFIIAVGSVPAGNWGSLTITTDANNPPTTARASVLINAYGSGATESSTIICPVKRGDRWTLTVEAGVTLVSAYWIPVGA